MLNIYQKEIIQFELVIVQSSVCALKDQDQTLVNKLTIFPQPYLGNRKQIANNALPLPRTGLL
jgi:hypothetical protein